MNKYITTSNGGQPIRLNDLRFMMGQSEYNFGLYQGLEAQLVALGANWIVSGLEATPGGGVTEDLSAGWVVLDSELLYCPAQVSLTYATDSKIVKTISYNTDGDKTTLSNDSVQTYQENRGVASGTTGNLDWGSGDRLIDVYRSLMSATTTTVALTGSWDLFNNATINIAHGLTTAQVAKISGINVVIFSNAGVITQLTEQNAAFNAIGGRITGVSSSNLGLERNTSGSYNHPDYNASTIKATITFSD